MSAVRAELLTDCLRPDRSALLAELRRTRAATLALAAPLSAEDQQVQSMPEASPVKWHLGHTTWFFDALLLARFTAPVGGDHLNYLFNSYYEGLGARLARAERGLITRPGLDEVLAYRREVEAALARLIEAAAEADWPEVAALLELGIQHEQQHQELILMDIKHLLFTNPARPAYLPERGPGRPQPASGGEGEWLTFADGFTEIGAGGPGFAFDNERPRHKVWSHGFRLSTRLVTCGEWAAFMAAGGYEQPELWLSDGWAQATAQGWRAPLYWSPGPDGQWTVFTLTGSRAVDPEEPVSHVSFYEADAFARWRGARLPSEAEWERAASAGSAGAASDRPSLHPRRAAPGRGLRQMFGAVWQWTASPYAPYPGFSPFPGPAAEYNGKFMSGQMVLRGSAAITPAGHGRVPYRNFYPPSARWVAAGVRLASDP